MQTDESGRGKAKSSQRIREGGEAQGLSNEDPTTTGEGPGQRCNAVGYDVVGEGRTQEVEEE